VLAQRDRIREIAASCNADSIALFGSTARGEDTEASDCDFLADLKPKTTLFHIARMKRLLEELLGCPVDIVSRRALSPRMGGAEAEAIPLGHPHRRHPTPCRSCRSRVHDPRTRSDRLRRERSHSPGNTNPTGSQPTSIRHPMKPE